MANCYIVRRGGAGGDEKNNSDVMATIGQYMEIAPVEETITNGKFLDWGLIADTIYTPNDIYQNGELWSTTPAEQISIVDLSTPVTLDGLTTNSALKIYGSGNDGVTYGWSFNINIPLNNKIEYFLYIGVSAEGSTYDLAYVELNGEEIGNYSTPSGTLTNHIIPLELSIGNNVITVKYKKDGATTKGDDCVYIYGYAIGHYGFIEREEE